jgi:hypothetical protein
VHGERRRHADLGRRHDALPDDLVAFMFDPVTAAVAVGWPGVATERVDVTMPSAASEPARFLRVGEGTAPEAPRRRTRVVTGVDGEAFGDVWLTAVERAATSR